MCMKERKEEKIDTIIYLRKSEEFGKHQLPAMLLMKNSKLISLTEKSLEDETGIKLL